MPTGSYTRGESDKKLRGVLVCLLIAYLGLALNLFLLLDVRGTIETNSKKRQNQIAHIERQLHDLGARR